MAKVLVSMPDGFLSQIDEIATIEQRTRSELIREALRSYLRKNRSMNPKLDEERAKIIENLLEE
jgi:metal-responsive CopG/Arc/MetJ family transcriptional regulator